MIFDDHEASEYDPMFFTQMYLRRVVAGIRFGHIKDPVWLADVIEYLAKNEDSFVNRRVYFHPAVYQGMIAWMRDPKSLQPSWMVEVVTLLVTYNEAFPPVDEGSASFVGYFYPH